MKIVKTISVSALCAIAMVAVAQDDSQKIRVMVDGDRVHFGDQQPMKTNDRVLVPLRGIFEKLGASVKWNPSNQTVTARKGDKVVKLVIGERDASVDGHDVHLDVPATLVGGSTMVPLRFVSESLGASVTWNDQKQEADIMEGPMKHDKWHGQGHPIPKR